MGHLRVLEFNFSTVHPDCSDLVHLVRVSKFSIHMCNRLIFRSPPCLRLISSLDLFSNYQLAIAQRWHFWSTPVTHADSVGVSYCVFKNVAAAMLSSVENVGEGCSTSISRQSWPFTWIRLTLTFWLPVSILYPGIHQAAFPYTGFCHNGGYKQ